MIQAVTAASKAAGHTLCIIEHRRPDSRTRDQEQALRRRRPAGLRPVARREDAGDRARAASAPCPTSTSVPTMFRTMWRRKPSPSSVITSTASSPPTGRASRDRPDGAHGRRRRRCRCPGTRRSRGARQARPRPAHRLDVERLRHVPDVTRERTARRTAHWRAVVVDLAGGAEARVEAGRRLVDRRDAHGRRQRRRSAPRRIACVVRRASASTLATWASACTPASVRPAPCTVTGPPSNAASASSSSPWTDVPSA